MNSIQIYASVTATGQTYVDLPQSERIKGVVFCASAASYSANDTLNVELSTVSTNQITVSDARSVAAVAAFEVFGGGSPASVVGSPMAFYCPSDVPVKGGDRIYLNYTESGSATWTLRALVFY